MARQKLSVGEGIISKLQGRNLHLEGMGMGKLILETYREMESGIRASGKDTTILRKMLETELKA